MLQLEKKYRLASHDIEPNRTQDIANSLSGASKYRFIHTRLQDRSSAKAQSFEQILLNRPTLSRLSQDIQAQVTVTLPRA